MKQRRHRMLIQIAISLFAFGRLWAATTPPQRTFASAQEAAEALITAAGSFNLPTLLDLFGPEGKELVSSADSVQDKNNTVAFAEKARAKHKIVVDSKNPSGATLIVGEEDWPFPVPLVRSNGKWAFNTAKGRDEILRRRIGTNELDAIQVCRGFVEAQMEYSALAREVTGVAQYAQKIFSSPGKRDGLFWQNADGSPGGPISKPIADALAEGYTAEAKTGYHGYYFTILKGQGPAAPLGELDYVIKDLMIGGFALLAVPAEYGVTGIQSFMVSYDGVVYQKDLGPDSVNLAKKVDRYNPDKTWKRTDDRWPTETAVDDGKR